MNSTQTWSTGASPSGPPWLVISWSGTFFERTSTTVSVVRTMSFSSSNTAACDPRLVRVTLGEIVISLFREERDRTTSTATAMRRPAFCPYSSAVMFSYGIHQRSAVLRGEHYIRRILRRECAFSLHVEFRYGASHT